LNSYRDQLLREAGYHKPEMLMTPTNWRFVFLTGILSVEFFLEFEEYLNWEIISKNNKISEEVLHKFNDKINWDTYFVECAASFSLIKKYITKTDFKTINDFYTAHLNSYQKQEIQKVLDFKNLFK
jgi:hypothetical protein